MCADLAWTGELTFPNPETSFSSTLADQKNTNNITGFKNKRDRRAARRCTTRSSISRSASRIIREIDGILANEHHYVLEWEAPFQRIAYWNKFGHPEGYLTRIGDYRDIADAVVDRPGESSSS